jgi:beta-carotene 3-hydroxylase
LNRIVFIALNIIIALATAAFWEFVAWFMHKYVMHGFGWYLHRDHHVTSGRKFQKNDLYALFFAGCSFLLIFFGLKYRLAPMASAGFGVGLYGIGYVTFHEIMFHKRIKAIQFRPKSRYLRRIVNAHRVHHSKVSKEHGESFSFLWAPRKYQPKPTA